MNCPLLKNKMYFHQCISVGKKIIMLLRTLQFECTRSKCSYNTTNLKYEECSAYIVHTTFQKRSDTMNTTNQNTHF